MAEDRNLILAFESSCDETSVAVIENGNKILSNIVATQIKSHKRFGGVVPEVAIILNRLRTVSMTHCLKQTSTMMIWMRSPLLTDQAWLVRCSLA